MRHVTAFCLFVLLSGHHARAQVFPSSSGGCAMSASGLMDCDWASVIEPRGTGKKKTAAQMPREPGHPPQTDRAVLAGRQT